MKALVYTAPGKMDYGETAAPVPGPGEVLFAVEAVGICGSDMHAYRGHEPRRAAPAILGHEACGHVVAGTSGGRRAVLNPLIDCGRCEHCLDGRSNLCAERVSIGLHRPGAFAELVAVPARNLIEIPDAMPAAQAALTEPAATSLHALRLAERALHGPVAAARALVLGGGSIGLLAALAVHHKGCRAITLGDTNGPRRETAAGSGVVRVFDPGEGPGPEADGFDLIVDAVGSGPSRASAFAAVKPGGVILHIGLHSPSGALDLRKLTRAEITLIGSYTYTPADLEAAVAALASGALGPLDWIEQRPLSQGARAFDDLDKGRLAAAKVVLTPG